MLDMCRELSLEFRPPVGSRLRLRWTAAWSGRTAASAATPARVRTLVVPGPRARGEASAKQHDPARHEQDQEAPQDGGDHRAPVSRRTVRNGHGSMDMRGICPVHDANPGGSPLPARLGSVVNA
jgi:hypothetical protein